MLEFNYQKASHHEIACNLCGSRSYRVVSRHDRHNLQEQSVICRKCGLIFINPRMSMNDYDHFYKSGFYRSLVARHDLLSHPRFCEPTRPEIVFEKARPFGLALAKRIKYLLPKGLLMEVGSAAGGLLSVFKEELGGVPVLGIEPAEDEVEYANNHGVPSIIGLFEQIHVEEYSPMTILCVQSLNHLLDPKKFFIWAHNSLSNDGRLVLVVQNFLTLARKIGSIHDATQIDHVYMFTPLSLRNFIESAGFEILLFEDWDTDEYTKIGLSSHHMAIVAKKTEVKPFASLLFNQQSYRKTIYSITRIRFHSIFIYPMKKIYRMVRKKLLKQFRRFAPNASC